MPVHRTQTALCADWPELDLTLGPRDSQNQKTGLEMVYNFRTGKTLFRPGGGGVYTAKLYFSNKILHDALLISTNNQTKSGLLR